MIVSREAAQAKQDRDARFDCETVCDCPLGKHASVDDVANAVLFFLSPDGDGVTGQTLYVSGGEIMPMP
ncbi:hypothetical protein SDC9_211685 [bioreactor metagenome]|uniref:3-oxoacyl-[acyl-carrier-protein] reductase n=1 Tax=bioreactor metagenome TaxID=1076179 RepID=A0A645JJR8_9ZZZZ